MALIHELKTWPVPYAAVVAGEKTYEIRRADRRYRVNDALVLREWTPPAESAGEGSYTGSFSVWQISHLTEGGAWGIPEHLVVLAVQPMPFCLIRRGSVLEKLVLKLQALGRELPEPDLLSLENETCSGCPACAPTAGLGRLHDGEMPGGRFRFN